LSFKPQKITTTKGNDKFNFFTQNPGTGQNKLSTISTKALFNQLALRLYLFMGIHTKPPGSRSWLC